MPISSKKCIILDAMGRKIEELDSETQELLAASVTIPSLSILVQVFIEEYITGSY